MRIIAVDDEPLATRNLVRLLRQVEPEAEITGFTDPEDAFAYLSRNPVNIAFLDIALGAYSGIALAEKCKSLCPEVNIIFVTGYSQYTMDAFKLHASGYLMKPVRPEDLRQEIQNLRYPVLAEGVKRVRVQTFGYFEVFVDGEPLRFPRAKCKECLAYLIDRRGARVTYPELAAVLWEDKPYDRVLQNNAQKIVSDLVKTLKEKNAEDILLKSRLGLSVDSTRVNCDYFDVVSGNRARLDAFTGEYMSNYSWAESTAGGLTELKRK